MTQPLRATIISDASYCHRSKAAGYGTWISADGIDRIRKAGIIAGSPANSTEAELKAVMIGMWYAYRVGVRVMLIQTDCLAVVEVVNRSTTPGQAALRRTLKDAIEAHMPGVEISAKHVKGHTTNEDARSWVNRWCDYHAGIHMRDERARRLGPKKKKGRHPDAERFIAAVRKQGGY